MEVSLFAPDGEPWCHFGKGFDCKNGEMCINHNAVPQIIAFIVGWCA